MKGTAYLVFKLLLIVNTMESESEGVVRAEMRGLWFGAHRLALSLLMEKLSEKGQD